MRQQGTEHRRRQRQGFGLSPADFRLTRFELHILAQNLTSSDLPLEWRGNFRPLCVKGLKGRKRDTAV